MSCVGSCVYDYLEAVVWCSDECYASAFCKVYVGYVHVAVHKRYSTTPQSLGCCRYASITCPSFMFMPLIVLAGLIGCCKANF